MLYIRTTVPSLPESEDPLYHLEYVDGRIVLTAETNGEKVQVTEVRRNSSAYRHVDILPAPVDVRVSSFGDQYAIIICLEVPDGSPGSSG